MTIQQISSSHQDCPTETIEWVAALNGWDFSRESTEEITISQKGEWACYDVVATWWSHHNALHFLCSFDFSAPPKSVEQLNELVKLANQTLWFGHFDYWQKDNLMVLRHTHFLDESSRFDSYQCQKIIGNVCNGCDRYYPAFHYNAWSGLHAPEALQLALHSPEGIA